ncbi:MAG: signal peptidase I [Thermodesulfovibrionia bacterium]|nr:signal peptidase I [Thermodesulfovibrionia bacterium]
MASKEPVNKSKSREYAEAIIIAVILAIIIRGFVVQAFKIPSGSMIPTLLIGDHLLVNKFIYGVKPPLSDTRFLTFSSPKKGDIIVFEFPGDKEKDECKGLGISIPARFNKVLDTKNPFAFFSGECRDFIKRIIAVGGDTVEIKDKAVYVNGLALSEPFKIHSDSSVFSADVTTRDNFGPITIPANKFFVMGDNRDNSHDGRFWGTVNIGDIKGKAFIIYWSWDNTGNLLSKIRWGRLGMSLH